MHNLKDKTEQELLEMQEESAANANVPSSIYHQITFELERRRQETNTQQISTLISEISSLKTITEKSASTASQNARSDNMLAKAAICIALASFLSQVLFSIKRDTICFEDRFENQIVYHSNCYVYWDFGAFGRYSFETPPYSEPDNGNPRYSPFR